MNPFDVLGDPVRRRILELLQSGPQSAGALAEACGRDFSISKAAVSQHLKVLRESGFVRAEIDGPRRIYTIEQGAFSGAGQWLSQFGDFWEPRLDALATEVARGKKARRKEAAAGGKQPARRRAG